MARGSFFSKKFPFVRPLFCNTRCLLIFPKNRRITETHMLNPDLVAKFKEQLEQMKTSLEADLAEVAEKKNGKNNSSTFSAVYPEGGSNSEDDNAKEISQYADELSLIGELETQLRDVVKALESVAKGTYGACKYCGQDIDLKRLEARPHSSSCVSCKKMLTQEL